MNRINEIITLTKFTASTAPLHEILSAQFSGHCSWVQIDNIKEKDEDSWLVENSRLADYLPIRTLVTNKYDQSGDKNRREAEESISVRNLFKFLSSTLSTPSTHA